MLRLDKVSSTSGGGDFLSLDRISPISGVSDWLRLDNISVMPGVRESSRKDNGSDLSGITPGAYRGILLSKLEVMAVEYLLLGTGVGEGGIGGFPVNAGDIDGIRSGFCRKLRF